MKFGTDIDKYGNRFSKYLKLVDCFRFQLQAMPLKMFHDYITLNNLSMLLTYTMTLYHNVHTIRES